MKNHNVKIIESEKILKNITDSQKKRFWKNIDKKEKEQCWQWKLAVDKDGYGRYNIGSKPNKTAMKVGSHRLSFLLHYGYLPSEKLLCHKCDNPKCCNPHHLFAGSHMDNLKDMYRKNRAKVGEACSNSKLTTEKVLRIRKLYETGKWSKVALGKEFNVSDKTIGNIVYNKKWKHI